MVEFEWNGARDIPFERCPSLKPWKIFIILFFILNLEIISLDKAQSPIILISTKQLVEKFEIFCKNGV